MTAALRKLETQRTYVNTKFIDWWPMLNAECAKLGVPDAMFGDAHGMYEMGESPLTGARHMAAYEAGKADQ